MHTRKDRLADRCTHREYYAQFVTNELKRSVGRSVGVSRLKASTDEHLNDIPLALWDTFSMPHGTAAKMSEVGDYLTMAGSVCISKEAARQIIEGETT